MILTYLELWLGRGLWIFLLIFFVGGHIIARVTGVHPLSPIADGGAFLNWAIVISLTISGFTLLSKLRRDE